MTSSAPPTEIQRVVTSPLEIPPPAIFRDPEDVAALARASVAVLGLIAVTILLLGLNAWQFFRRPDRVVVTLVSERRLNDRGEVVERRDRVAEINNQQYGAVEDGLVQMRSDRIGAEEKRLVAAAFVAQFCAIDPRPAPGGGKTFRGLQLEKMFRMMTPGAARQFADRLKTSGALEREARENWQATWTDWESNVEIDSRDPFSVRIQGVQTVVKTVGGEAREQTRRLQFVVKLAADKDGRTAENLLTGLRVIACELKEIL
jgi:hypothetical protein